MRGSRERIDALQAETRCAFEPRRHGYGYPSSSETQGMTDDEKVPVGDRQSCHDSESIPIRPRNSLLHMHFVNHDVECPTCIPR